MALVLVVWSGVVRAESTGASERVGDKPAVQLESVTIQVNSQNTRLDEVNAALGLAAGQFGVDAETWDDVFKGTVGSEVALSITRVPFLVTGALYVSNGQVETDSGFVDPLSGPARFHLRQEYTIITPEVGIKYPFPRWGRVQAFVMVGLSYVFLASETEGSVEFSGAPEFNMSFKTSDHPDGLGWYGGIAFDVRVSKRWAFYGVWRYNDVELTASDGTSIDLTASRAVGLGATIRFSD